METTDATQVVQATQDVYNVWSWLLPLLSGTVGALIGTYCGSHFLHWKKEKKIKRVRAMAVKALNIFKEYAQKKRIMQRRKMSLTQNLVSPKKEL